MRASRFFRVALVLTPLLSTAQAAEKSDAPLRAWLDQWTKAFTAKDTKAVMALYAPDVLAYDIVPPLAYVGKDAYGKDYQEFFADFDGPVGMEIRDLHTGMSGDLGYILAFEHLTGTSKSSGKVDVWLRITTIVRKIDGRWLDIHDHASVPADFATGKAALDLKP